LRATVYGFDVSGRIHEGEPRAHDRSRGIFAAAQTHAAGVIAGIIAEVGDGRKRSASAHARKKKIAMLRAPSIDAPNEVRRLNSC
jgi:hypothetical protein